MLNGLAKAVASRRHTRPAANETVPCGCLPLQGDARRLQQRAYMARAASLGVNVNNATKNWMTFRPCRLAV
jgi:hypothetical protein